MKACLLVGSNIGNRELYLFSAKLIIEKKCGKILKTSKIYETEPWGFQAETRFLNQALLLETTHSPEDLLAQCLLIESQLGRKRYFPNETIEKGNKDDKGELTFLQRTYTSRTMDIDILFYDNVVCQSPTLTLPHPQLHLRAFALEPLNEVSPEWKHPIFSFTAKEMLKGVGNF